MISFQFPKVFARLFYRIRGKIKRVIVHYVLMYHKFLNRVCASDARDAFSIPIVGAWHFPMVLAFKAGH